MEYKLVKKIEIKDNIKDIYSWCLNEVDPKTNEKGEDLVPWASSLYFIGSTFKVANNIFNSDWINPLDDGNKDSSKFSKVIVGIFHSGYCGDGENLGDVVHYTMFGRDKKISEFKVRITCDGDKEFFRVDGEPAYTYENDFSVNYQKDWIEFTINLRRENFEKIIDLIEMDKVGYAALTLKMVPGFYSSWSPSIRTNSIKILTERHKIENIENSQQTPAVLGDLGHGSFNLMLGVAKDLDVKMHSHNFDIDKAFEVKYEDDVAEEYPELLIDTLNKSNTDMINKLGSVLRLPLWVISALLFILVLK